MTMTPLETAIKASQLGISTWPPKQDKSKKPDGSWKRGQEHVATEDEIRAQYARGRTGVGFVCGSISGNLECLDFDDRATWDEYQTSAKRAGLDALLNRVAAGYLEHSPNGAHLLYRCDEIAGNTKLAQRRLSGNERKSLIETRGEGGYVIVAPSHGSINKNGNYVLISGGLDSIVTLTPNERKALHDLARIFDECLAVVDHRPAQATAHDGTRPGDDYAAKVTWADILEPHGWLALETRNGVTMWRRPGKNIGEGSATTNHGGSDLLYVFSTSTCFEPNRGINKFSAYATLNHGGDFAAAASALALEGYGVEAPIMTEAEISEFIARSKAAIAARELQAATEVEAKPPAVAELLSVPGVLGEFMRWVDSRSPKPQPILALGAGLAACGMILGQRVESWTGLRSNLYVIGVGESGCGKDSARKAIVRWFADAGLGDSLGDKATSGAAFEAAVARNPRRLFLVDEFGHYLERMNDPNAPTHVKDMAETLLNLYTSSSSTFYRRERAENRDKNKKGGENLADSVEQPCLCIYGTTTPRRFLGALTSGQLVDGLAGRLLFVESTDPDPDIRDVYEGTEPAPVLLTWAKEWASIPKNPHATGNLEKRGIGVDHCRPVRIVANGAAIETLADFSASIRRRCAEARAEGGTPELWARTREQAIKLAMIRACGTMTTEITEATMEWGCSLAWVLAENLAGRAAVGVSESKSDEHSKTVVEIIRAAGTDGASKADITRATRKLSPRERDDALRWAVEAEVVVEVMNANTGGRPSRTYYHRGGSFHGE